MDPFDVNETSFQEFYNSPEAEKITGMTIHINTPGDGVFIDTQIEQVSPVLRKQIFLQIASIISTLKKPMELL